MKRYFIMFVIFLVALSLPGTLFHYLSWAGIKPDLPMLWAIYLALHHRPSQGIGYGFIVGLFTDLYIGRYIGLNTITFAVVGFLISFLQQRWYKENIPLTMVLVFIATALGQTLLVLIAKAAGLHWFVGEALQIIIGIAFYNSLLVPITYPLIHRAFTSGCLYKKTEFEQR